MMIISVFHYSFWKRLSYPLLFFSALLLILVLFPAIGSEIYGARRWIRIGFVIIQPVEILKFSFIVWVADFLARKKNEFQVFSRSLMPIFVIFSFFAMLLLLQPDFGSIVLLLGCTILVCYIAGTRLKGNWFEFQIIWRKIFGYLIIIFSVELLWGLCLFLQILLVKEVNKSYLGHRFYHKCDQPFGRIVWKAVLNVRNLLILNASGLNRS